MKRNTNCCKQKEIWKQDVSKENKKKTPGKRMFFMLCAIGVSAGPVLAVRHDLLAARHVLNGG